MANIITDIQLSGITYQIQGSGGGNPTVELTQAQYDALVDKDPNVFYIITDAEAGDLTNYYTKTETDNAITAATSTKQDTLVSGTNIKTINNESLLGSGNIDIQGGSTYTAGRGISIANDAISFNLPISAGTGNNSIIEGANTIASGAISHAEGRGTLAKGNYSHAEGNGTMANGTYSHAEGSGTIANGNYSHAEGNNTEAKNQSEHASGQYNVSSKANNTFGNSGNTLFSVGNGTTEATRHNAFEIRQNGDIYLSLNGQDVKLQDQLGGSSITVVQTTGTSTTDVMSQNAVSTKLSGYVTTDTTQTISSQKIFTYGNSSGSKAIEFKQTMPSYKVGFRVINSASTNNEVASFEFRPNTFTVDGVQHPLLYFGHYRNTATANAGVPQTVIGFRQYDQKNGAAYHYLIPLPEKAKTPFGLTATFKDYYAPMGFKNGSTMIKADNTGVVDLSSELGGLKLKKLTQAEYDALATKDSNTLYVIVN